MNDDSIYKAQNGDPEAFRELIEEYYAVAWRTARILLPDKESIEDALQEAWIDAWRGLPGFHYRKPFRPWLLAIVANRCRMIIRRREIATVSLETMDISDAIGLEDVLNHILTIEGAAHLSEVLARLSVEQQQLLKLRFFC